MKRSKIAILGGGSWGTTTASIVSRQCDATLWARDAQIVKEINRHHTNGRYLPDAMLHPKLRATTDIQGAVNQADAVLIAVPSSHFREVLSSALTHLPASIPVISLSKGLEKGSRMRMTEIIREVAPGRIPGVLTGPNLAREIVAAANVKRWIVSGLHQSGCHWLRAGWCAQEHHCHCGRHGRRTGRR